MQLNIITNIRAHMVITTSQNPAIMEHQIVAKANKRYTKPITEHQ